MLLAHPPLVGFIQCRKLSARVRRLTHDAEVELLVELFGMGLLPANTLQAIGAAATSVAPRPQMQTLANLGCTGKWHGNCHRDLTRKLSLGGNTVPKPMMIALTLWNAASRPPSAEPVQWPFLLRHEILAYMFENFRGGFDNHFVGPAPLSNFWDSVPVNDPRLTGHPVRGTLDYRQRAIPLRLHGDGVPVGKARGRSLDILGLSSLTGTKAST